MYELQDWAAVQRIYRDTKSIRKTAKILDMARNTVRRLLKMKTMPTYNRTIYTSCLDPYKERIIAWRCKPYEFNGTRIFKELKKLGYARSIGPVYRFLQRIDEDVGRISSRATVRIETPPGDQAQFDWSEYLVVVGCHEKKVYCFSMILAASRKKAICFSLTVDAEAIYEAIQELFEDLGGVTLELLTDNPKALVLKNDPRCEEEILYNPNALMLAKHLGTELNACPCYWPRKKGKIEAPFKYIEEQFIKGNTFASMEDLNRRGKEFINAWCNETHSTTRRIPNQHYLLEEKQKLLPLPANRYITKSLKKRIVSSDCHVSIDTNKYSVPAKYADKILWFRMVYGFRIEIYARKEARKGDFLLALEALDAKNEVYEDKAHYDEICVKVSTSIPQIRRDFAQRFSNGQRYLEAAGRKFSQPTYHARKIMELQDLYDDETLDRLIGFCIDHNKMDIKSFKKMLREYNAGKLVLQDTPTMVQTRGSTMEYHDDNPALTRDCSYYEMNAMAEVSE